LFTWFQFGIKSNGLAMVDVLLVLGTLVWAMIAIYPHVKWIALANIPYLAWVCFATTLQVTITILNFKK
jgi:tryptophan-rich sensory protein